MKTSKPIQAWLTFLSGGLAVADFSVTAGLMQGVQGLLMFLEDSTDHIVNLPLPPNADSIRNKDDLINELRKLEQTLLNEKDLSVSYEHIQAAFGYKSLWHLYPDLVNDWVPPVGNLSWLYPKESSSETNNKKYGPVTAPFIEVFSSIGYDKLAVEFKHSNIEYNLPAVVKQYRYLLGEKPFDDGYNKIRIDNLKIEEKSERTKIEFLFSSVTYEEYWYSNWAIANTPFEISRKLRENLCGIGELFSLEDSRCSNHLGVNALVTTSDGFLVIPKSNSKVKSSPNMWIPSVSGSADLKPDYLTRGEKIISDTDILREAAEELRIKYDDLKNLPQKSMHPRLLSVCRNVLRGGKPELFFHIFIEKKFDDIEGNISEDELIEVRALPALMDSEFNMSSDYDLNLVSYSEYLTEIEKDKVTVSPYLKVALYYYLSYCKSLFNKNILGKNGLPSNQKQ